MYILTHLRINHLQEKKLLDDQWSCPEDISSLLLMKEIVFIKVKRQLTLKMFEYYLANDVISFKIYKRKFKRHLHIHKFFFYSFNFFFFSKKFKSKRCQSYRLKILIIVFFSFIFSSDVILSVLVFLSIHLFDFWNII